MNSGQPSYFDSGLFEAGDDDLYRNLDPEQNPRLYNSPVDDDNWYGLSGDGNAVAAGPSSTVPRRPNWNCYPQQPMGLAVATDDKEDEQPLFDLAPATSNSQTNFAQPPPTIDSQARFIQPSPPVIWQTSLPQLPRMIGSQAQSFSLPTTTQAESIPPELASQNATSSELASQNATSSGIASSAAASSGVASPEAASPRIKRRSPQTMKEVTGSPEEVEKRRRFLERNRIAASKCREKKKRQNLVMEQRSAALEAENHELKQKVDALNNQVEHLKSLLMGHSKCGDPCIDAWFRREALRFASENTQQIGT